MAGFRTLGIAAAAGLLASGLSAAVAPSGGVHAAPPMKTSAAPGVSPTKGHLHRGVMPVFGTGRGATKPAAAAAPVAPPRAHLSYYGGSVVSTIRVVQVLYGQPSTTVKYESEVQDVATSPSVGTFYGAIASSSYVDSMSEYNTTGSPQGTSGTNQTITRGGFDSQNIIAPSQPNNPFAPGNTTHTIDDTQIQAELKVQIAAHTLPAPARDGAGKLTTLYATYFPISVHITLHVSSGTEKSGVDFCAYHGTTSAPEAYYSVLPDFTTGGMATGCGGGTEFQNVMSVSSHEFAEVITDPEVGLATGAVGSPLAWYDVNNGENGDICNGINASVVGHDAVAYTVQKLWSNAQNACVTAPATPPPAPPAPFHPHGVGAPQVAVTPDGSTQLVFWSGSDGLLHEAWYTGNWNGPITFPQLGHLTSAPSVAVTRDGSTQLVFWQGPNRHLLEAWYAGSWNGPVDLTAAWGGAGLLASSPSVVPTADGEQLVFWRGIDGHLWEAWYTGRWNGPADFSTLGTLASSPSATITPDGSQQLVFWPGVDNRLTEVWFSGSWHGPVEFANLGLISSTPSVVVTPDGSTQLVFYRSPWGDLLESWYAGSWNGPLDLTSSSFGGKGTLTSSPSATVTPDGSSQLVFWQGPRQTLWESWYAGGAWHGPVDFSAG
ncbi:MAG: hypothetical protein JF886_08995 [Candidatus Dormibacteraeota bacterium]|uniref:PLL-like beta propeller domain-containing protein n=1 Tax=Candidatus Aeolococcus gillhamiae TaxID=3127015 RepID=A0A934N5K5_9BACT|nr:hypothetical protein [Candidatus Dormibacteraeota bacterium]